MQRATCSHTNLDVQSASANLKLLRRKVRSTDSFGIAPSRNMDIGKRRTEIQDWVRTELEALEDELLLQQYEEPKEKLEADADHNSLLMTEMAHSESENVIAVEVLSRVNEVIREGLAKIMTAIVSQILSHSYDEEEKRQVF